MLTIFILFVYFIYLFVTLHEMPFSFSFSFLKILLRKKKFYMRLSLSSYAIQLFP